MTAELFILFWFSNALAVDVQINNQQLQNVQEQVLSLKGVLENVIREYGSLRELEQKFNRLSDEMEELRNNQKSNKCRNKTSDEELVGKEINDVRNFDERLVSPLSFPSMNHWNDSTTVSPLSIPSMNHWNDSTTVPVDVKGETGDAGIAGPKGDTGETGPQGNLGLSGGPGPKGEMGMPGKKGDIGPMGIPGQKGDAGSSGNAGQGLISSDIDGYIIHTSSFTSLWGQFSPHNIWNRPGMKAAFTARTDKMVDLHSSGNIILFNHVETNEGNYYNANDGVFTCGLRGTYVFAWSIEVTPRAYIYSSIEVNGVPRMYLAISGAEAHYNVGTQTIVLQLAVHDRVYIREQYHTDGSVMNSFSSFTGFRLY